jgi:putative sigma-54 modulation protein
MEKTNDPPQITVTARHTTLTDAMRDYAVGKIGHLHMEYPRVIEAKAILDVQNDRQIAEIILFCANHVTIEASSESEDLYKSIDETIAKVARQMRKEKTRMLKNHR